MEHNFFPHFSNVHYRPLPEPDEEKALEAEKITSNIVVKDYYSWRKVAASLGVLYFFFLCFNEFSQSHSLPTHTDQFTGTLPLKDALTKTSESEQPLTAVQFPKLVHMTTPDKHNIPADVQKYISGWEEKNSDHTVIVYDDKDMRDMVKAHAPTMLAVYDGLETIVEKADFWRYLVMYVHGGVYVDTDVECITPIKDWTKYFVDARSPKFKAPQVIIGVEVSVKTEEERIYNGFTHLVQFLQWGFISQPKHPLFWEVLMNIADYVRKEKKGEIKGNRKTDIVNRTGPGVFTNTVNAYLAIHRTSPSDVVSGFPVVGGVGFVEQPIFGSLCNLDKDENGEFMQFILHHFKGSWKGAGLES